VKILYLSRFLPAPGAGHGGSEYTFELLAALAEHHDVSLLCYADGTDGQSPEALERLGVEVTCVPYPRGPGTRDLRVAAGGLLRALARGVPFAAAKYDQQRFRRHLRERLRVLRPDVLHAESSVLAPYLQEGPRGTRLLVLTHLGTRLASTRARAAGSLVGRGLAALRAPLWRRYERRAIELADAVIAFTAEDAALTAGWPARAAVRVVSPAVPMPGPNARSPRRDPNALAFAASFDQTSNRHALEALLARVLPSVREDRPEAVLRVAGRRLPPRWQRRIEATPGARYEGFLADIDEFLAGTSVFVAPLTSGSGLKLKVARALACGTPVVTTPIGAEGIDVGPEDGLFVEEHAAGLAARAVALLADPDGTRRLGERARARTRSLLAGPIAAAALTAVYAELGDRSARTPSPQDSSPKPRPQSGHSLA
jgi:glycosyltransferase involved in cell wall biosynthesis